MMLFGFAIGSTILFLVFMISAFLDFRGPFVAVDSCINLWCLYLQFAFATKQYTKCCGWCDKRCRDWGVKRTKKIILKHSMEISMQNARKESTHRVTVEGSNSQNAEIESVE